MRYTHYDEHKKRWQINDDYGAMMIDDLNYAVGEAVDKLAAYEDTGLTPETCKDIKSLCDDYVDAGLDASFILACIAAARAGISSKRMTEISKAETDNRLIILPCKLGDTVYVEWSGGREYSKSVVEKISIGTNGQARFLIPAYLHSHSASWYQTSDFGKTVFLTRAEAELKGDT